MKILGYSERGLMNALVRSFQADTGSLQRFVGAIRLAGRTPVRVTDHPWAWVEPSFSEFGDPDLVLGFDNDHEQLDSVLFVEAKITSWEKSALPNVKGVDGYCSSINGQLALKYRFACAARTCGSSRRISESQDVFAAYAELVGDRFPGNSRSLRS